MNEAQITKTATNALTDLVDTSRTRAEQCRANGMEAQATTLDHIAKTLDGARTRLVEDGSEYLDAAWAFIDAGRKMLAAMAHARPMLDRIERTRS